MHRCVRHEKEYIAKAFLAKARDHGIFCWFSWMSLIIHGLLRRHLAWPSHCFVDCWHRDPRIVYRQWFQMFIITTAPTPTYADSDHNVLLSLWSVENEYMRCFSQGLVELGWVSHEIRSCFNIQIELTQGICIPRLYRWPSQGTSPRNSVRHGRSEFSLVALKTREMRWRRRFTTSWKPWVWRRYEFCFSAQWEFLAPLWNHNGFCTHVHSWQLMAIDRDYGFEKVIYGNQWSVVASNDYSWLYNGWLLMVELGF